MKLTPAQRRVLERLAEGWRPLRFQIEWKRLERAGLVRLDYGPDNTKDADKLCVYLTEEGRRALKKHDEV